MSYRFDNSIIAGGLNDVLIESGRVINVNMRRWTADVMTQVNQSLFLDIQWANPYLHFAQGEGIFAMPEVGSQCMVCRPSDSTPFIMCFVTSFERSQTEEEDQGERDISEGQEQSNANINFSAGRPDLQQGDLMLRCRDGNQIWLRRGGVVEIGSTAVSKRLYIPLLNYIRDLCENYALHTFGGDLSWTVERSDSDPEGRAKALLKVVAKEAAQDEKATVALRMGEVTDDDRLSLIIAPNAINMETLEVEGGPLFELKIDNEGNIVSSMEDATITVEGDFSVTVEGSASYTFDGGHSIDVTGNQETTISGSHKLSAVSSEEDLSGSKLIDCPSIDLGGTGGEPTVKGITLLTWLASHSHPTTGGPPVTQPPNILSSSTRVK